MNETESAQDSNPSSFPKIRNANCQILSEMNALAIQMMVDNRRRLHPEEDPMDVVRARLRAQAEDKGRANIRAFIHVK